MIEDRVRIPCGTLVRQESYSIELDVTSNGAYGDHVLRGMFENALGGADVQKGQSVSGLIKTLRENSLSLNSRNLPKIAFLRNETALTTKSIVATLPAKCPAGRD